MLFSYTTICILEVILMVYPLIVLLVVLYYAYMLLLKNYIDCSLSISNRYILRIISITYMLSIFIIKCCKFINITIFFGHLLITNLSISIWIFLLILSLIATNIVIFYKNGSSLLKIQTILIIQMLILTIFALYCATTIFAIILTIDCMNILILLLLLIDIQITTKNNLDSGFVSKLNGISIYFWVSFVATTLLFIGGYMILLHSYTQNINVLLIFATIESIITTSIDFSNTIGFTLMLLGLIVKSGIGPFFIWKRHVFISMKYSTLAIYIFIYFLMTFMYINYLIVTLSISSYISIVIILTIIFIITILLLVNSFDNGTTLADFFVISTLFNSTLTLLLITSLVYII